jgi:phosphatidylglycerophosphatase A
MRKFRLTLWKFIITGFGIGYSPVAPGTIGAIGALIPGFLIIRYAPCPYLILVTLVLIFTILGIIGSNKLQPLWGKDPSRIVIDEMVGMWISLLWIGTGGISFLSAIILFRFFDIVKPLGIRKLEQLPGGTGVMADDILAGLYTNLILQVVFRIIPVMI